MKRSILIAALTSFLMSLQISPINAQILRLPCAGGNCYQSARIVQNTRVYAPYSYRAAVERLETAQAVAPCAAAVNVEEIPEPTVEPCAPVEAVEPCGPVANCAATGTLTHGAGYEILAFNYSGIDAACGQWLNSPAHRALLLSPNFRAAGVAVVKGKDGRVYCAVRFR